MKRTHVFIASLLGALSIQMLPAQVVTSAVPFLLIAPNSRASGMGEAGVALADDGWAIFWNPAGYAFQHGSEVAISHANWLPQFHLSDLWIAHFVYKQEVPELDGTVAAGLTYLNLGEFNQTGENGPDIIGTFKGFEFAIAGGYGTRLTQDLGIGVNTRFIYSRLAPFGAGQEKGEGVSSGFSFDVGLLYKPRALELPLVDLGDRINFGLNISNIGPHMAYIDKAQADPLPMNFRIGLAVKLMESQFNNLTVISDFSRLLITRDSLGATDPFYKAFFTSWYKDKSFGEMVRQFVTGVGLEYWYGDPKLIALRAGYFYEDPRAGNRKFATFGGGIRYDLYEFDFSYISAFEDQHPLGETLRFTLGINWGGPAE